MASTQKIVKVSMSYSLYYVILDQGSVGNVKRIKLGINLVKELSLCSVMSGDVRLVGGTTPCSGQLEQKHQGEWRAVEVKIKDWNLTAAAAVCRQLNCGSAVLTQRTPAIFFPGLAESIVSNIHFIAVTPKINCSGSYLF